jgi:hypothetical protein
MVSSITAILQLFTDEWAVQLDPEAILAVSGEIAYTRWHDRMPTLVTTVELFLLQMLHGHTGCSHLPHLSRLRCCAAAYCQARAELPLHLFALLFDHFGRAVRPCVSSESGWQGHRPFLVDGSGCSMPIRRHYRMLSASRRGSGLGAASP